MGSRIYEKRPFQLFLDEWLVVKHIDQDTLAERMDCAPGTVSKLFNGKMKMTTDWLARIAHALGDDVEVDDLFHDPNQPTQADLFRNIPEKDQAKIIKAIKALTDTDS